MCARAASPSGTARGLVLDSGKLMASPHLAVPGDTLAPAPTLYAACTM